MEADQPIIRVGIGTDLHRLAAGRRLVLGGVTVPFELGLAGHSDGDVVLHAVMDAILGAAGLPDIGAQFPDDDPALRGADSREMMRRTVEQVRRAGYRIVNVDLVVHAERPRLSAHKSSIRDSVAALLGVEGGRVSIKAKTAEGTDAVGRGEAIACTAVAGLSRSEP